MRDSKRETDIKNRLLDFAGEGEDGMISENSIKTCVLSYAKQITSPSLMQREKKRGKSHYLSLTP